MNVIKKILIFSLVLVSFLLQSQEVPPIQIFTPQDYDAEDQNWAITQSQNGFIYVANNKGLLEYDGAKWKIFNSPNDGILRSVRVVGDRVYTGGYRDFGYWSKNDFGVLQYSSLAQSENFSVKDDEEFWGIIAIEGYVLFQSFERIYIYNTSDKSFKIIDSDLRINKMFKVGQRIYFQKTGEGIFRIESGKEVLHIPYGQIGNKEVINIFSHNDGLLLQTRENGFFTFKDETIEKWDIPADALLTSVSVYSSAQLKNGGFILGTISNGILHLDADGSLLLNIDQSRGLSNNTVLSVEEDVYENVWLGLDNGINVLNLNAPYRVYTDKQGVLGTVYTSAKLDSYLYLGTNQGLFYKDVNAESKFSFIEGTQGQVWSIQVVNGEVFCGHDTGTFIVKNDRAEKIASEKGTWGIKSIEGQPNLLIQSNYKGLSILEKLSDNSWIYRNKIEGFDISSRYFDFINANEILVSHEHKGVFKIKIDSTFNKVLSFEKIAVNEGIKSSIFRHNNDVLYSYKDGVYHLDKSSYTFEKDSLLSALFGGEKYISGKMINDKDGNRLWGFTQDEIIYVEPGKLSGSPEVNVIPISSEMRKTKAGYENILRVDNNNYLIGSTEGYIVINTDKLKYDAYEIYLNSASYYSLRNEVVPLGFNDPAELKNNENSIRFKYSITNYNKLTSSLYQYRLEGKYDNWSSWSSNSEVLFENLPFGDYTFEARAKTGGVISKNKIVYNFSIDRPWHLSSAALIIYFLLVVFLGFLLHYFNRRHYKKHEKDLLKRKEREMELEQSENQRQLMEVKNENLQLDIENKNRELGIATMNLVKRNELLNNIKDELSKTKSMTEVKRVIKLINSSLNSSNDWKLFEEAFNNVDKDFMKRIKALHPSITPNDLRLCAYLRLNLSSKEIAPLLNISHKSVEVKRYRLRKKMDLDHDESLSNYIIEL